MNKNEFAKMLKEILEDAYHAANTENHKDSFILKFIQEIGAKTEQCPICKKWFRMGVCVQQVDKWRTAARKLANKVHQCYCQHLFGTEDYLDGGGVDTLVADIAGVPVKELFDDDKAFDEALAELNKGSGYKL